jgi:hypothetical protein
MNTHLYGLKNSTPWQCIGILILLIVRRVSSFQNSWIFRPSHLRNVATRVSASSSSSNNNDNDTAAIVHLTHIDRVLCISDLHTDHVDNLGWLRNNTGFGRFGASDLIVVAGDISHELDRLEDSMKCLLQDGASVLFVPGNHEAWLHSRNDDTITSSLEKLDRIYRTCHELGVLTGPTLVGGTEERPEALWIAPLESWYDGTLGIENCEDLCDDFGRWPWVDFIKCQWPGFPPMGGREKNIPSGLTDYFLGRNVGLLKQVEASVTQSTTTGSKAVMTVSHFLPNQQCLPDWKDLSASTFDRENWLGHGVGGTSAKFAKVAGTKLLDDQIRSDLQAPSDVRRFHLFGHSHRPKDFEFQGIRYIHNPLGKPRERELFMVSPSVDFQHLWDTRRGETAGETVIRLWEERGGGVEALRERMQRSKRRTRYGAHKHMKVPSSSSSSSLISPHKSKETP